MNGSWASRRTQGGDDKTQTRRVSDSAQSDFALQGGDFNTQDSGDGPAFIDMGDQFIALNKGGRRTRTTTGVSASWWTTAPACAS